MPSSQTCSSRKRTGLCISRLQVGLVNLEPTATKVAGKKTILMKASVRMAELSSLAASAMSREAAAILRLDRLSRCTTRLYTWSFYFSYWSLLTNIDPTHHVQLTLGYSLVHLYFCQQSPIFILDLVQARY